MPRPPYVSKGAHNTRRTFVRWVAIKEELVVLFLPYHYALESLHNQTRATSSNRLRFQETDRKAMMRGH